MKQQEKKTTEEVFFVNSDKTKMVEKNVVKKSNKKFRVSFATGIAGIAFAVGTLMGATACKGPADPETVKYSFDTMGGAVISEVDIKIGEEFTLPEPQAREGYAFDGWYASNTFEGEPVTVVVAQSNQTYYAKWTQLSKITLELDGGELANTTLYLKAGENLYDFMQAYVPQKDGLTFGAWFNGENVLASNAKMPSDGITLTARYQVRYTVQFYVQNLEGTGYELSEETVTGSAYVNKDFVSTQTLAGCEENTTHPDRVTSKKLTENASENVFKHYFDRLTYSITFVPNYPNGAQAEDEVYTKKYGEYITVPDNYALEGYCLIGWATSPTAKVPEYEAYYVDTMLQNAESGDRESASFTPTEHLRLYGVWAKGYTDMFNGDDYLFFLEKTEDGEIDESIIYLSRGNVFFKGEYSAKFNEFYFFGDDGEVILTGKLYENNKFAYISTKRSGKIAYLYSMGVGLEEGTRIEFDEINGVTYIVNGDQTKGSQQMNDDGEYVADFTAATEGVMAGKKLTFILGKYNDQNAFIPLKEEERNLGTLKRFYYNSSEKTLATYTSGFGDLTLDGYGNATYNNGSQITSYYYSYEDGVITLTTQYGGLFGRASIFEYKGTTGYVLYTQWQDATFEIGNGTLVLDGGIKAVYTNGDKTIEGYYSVVSSLFGGYIVKIDTESNERFTFIISEVEVDDEENLVSYEIRTALNSYAEYRYLSEGKVYNAAVIVLDEAVAGRLTLYGFNSRLNEFVKVSEGPYTKTDNADDSYYQYTVENAVNGVEGILTSPVNPANIKSFVFALDSETTAYNLFYWESSVSTDEPPVLTQYVTEYECATEDKAALKLVGGFAYYTTKDGVSVSGAYAKPEEDKNYIVILTSSIAGNVNYYVELDEDNKQFIPLDYAPYKAYLYNEAGKLQNGEDDGVYISFDGKGNATFVDANGVEVVGKVKLTDDKTGDIYIYEFTANDNSLTFKYLGGLSVGSVSAFIRYNDTYNGSYDYYQDDVRIGSLELDGFGYIGKYFDNDGNTFEGRYLIVEENVIALQESTSNQTMYFDIVNRTARTFTVRSEEYGEYLWIKNRDWQKETYFELNGYGVLSVYTKTKNTDENTNEVTYTKNYICQNGTYEKDGDTFILRYTDAEQKVKVLYGELGLYSSANAFIEKLDDDDPVIGVYVNEKDWSVLILDGAGNAIKYAGEEDSDVEVGQKEVGYYTLITENLLYFVNAKNTDACLYEYDFENYTATQVKFDNTRYLTSEMEILTFYEYGFLVLVDQDGTTTRHYYKENYDQNSDVKEVVELTIYVSDPDNVNASKYGFIEKTLTGGYGEQFVFEGKTYFKNADDVMIFDREEENAEAYPIVSGSAKYSLSELKFEAVQSIEFQASGTVSYNGKETACVVVREKNEAGELITYVTVGDYRFYVEFDYKGLKEDLTTESTYTITGMEFHQISYPSNYLDYYYYYGLYGNKVENTLGTITIHGSYKEDGTAENIFVDAEFLENSSVKDMEGNLITFEGATYIDHGVGTYGQHYEAIFTAQDGNTYSLHFIVSKHSSVNAYAFNILALTRHQTFGENTDEYQIITERVMYSEYSSFEKGDLFNIALKKNGVTLEGSPVLGRKDIIQYVDGCVMYVVRESAEGSTQYTAATYYVIELISDPLTENTDGTVEIPFYTSSQVLDVQTVEKIVYAENGKYFVEFINGQPTLLCMNQETFIVKESESIENAEIEDEYLPTDGATVKNAYVVTTATNGARYMVQIREKTVDGSVITYVYVQSIYE